MRKEVTRYSMEFVKNIVTDSNTIEILLDYLPDRVFVYNKTNKTIYEKIDDEFCPLGSEESYTKGKNALHYEGELSKISDLDSGALDGSVYLIENDTTTYEHRIVNSLFIKLPNNTWKEVRLNVYSIGEVDKMMNDEKTAREEADTILQENIDAEAQARESADITLQENIDEEARIRESADTTLQENIDKEAQAREAADVILQENIDNEAKTREDADNTLQENINLEAQTRESADTILQENIDLEAQARESADVTLQENIDTEAQARKSADDALLEAHKLLTQEVEKNAQSIKEINSLLKNIDFDNNIVIQYNSDLTEPPADFSSYVVGTAWKITEDFTLNGEEVPKNTFIFKKNENTLDILGGGNSKKALFEEARIVSNNNVWVTNYYLGNTKDKGRYIIFNLHDAIQSYSYGHFLVKGSQNVYNFDMLLNRVNGVLNNFWTSGEAPAKVFTVTRLGKTYYALNLDSVENFEVYYTGWISSNFEVFNYVESDLSDFSPVALGELDLDNLPKGSSVPYEPMWKYSEGSVNSLVEYWENWDFENYPIAYVRPILNPNGNLRSLDCRYVFGDGGDGESLTYWQTNLNALKTILGDPNRPTYLLLDKMTHLNKLSVERIGVFLGGVSNPFPGLKGLYLPQDEDSSYCGAEWWGTNTDRLFLVNFENLEYLKLNPYTKTLGTYCLRDLHSLKSIVMPEALTTLDFNDDRPFLNCDALTAIYLPSTTTIIDVNGTYGTVIRDFWLRDGGIYVKNNLLQDYRLKFELDGYIISSLRGY